MSQTYQLGINGPLFKQQRALLAQVIYSGDTIILTPEQLDTLEGLQSLCDEIADQAHDNHGLDTINSEMEEF